MLSRALGQAACGLAFLLLALLEARAGSFAVSPVRATLSTSQPVSSLVVRNNGGDSVVVQLEVVSWSQQDGKDVYTPTKEILATPPIFTIPAGGAQIVRVGLRRGSDAQRELTYRVFLQEVPSKSDYQGLRVVLRMGIPVFVSPPVAATPSLRWQAAYMPDGALKLTVRNDGNAHIQLANSKLILSNSGEVVSAQQVGVYVLPGETRDWLLKPASLPPRGSALRISASTDAGDMQADVAVENH